MKNIKIRLGSRWRRKDDHSRVARIDYFFKNKLGYETNLVSKMWCDTNRFLELYELSPVQPASTKKAPFINKRHIWILNYMVGNDGIGIDVLNADAVNSYINQFNLTFSPTNYGAPKCEQLSKDLARLYKMGLLDRSTIGISAMVVSGYPKWIHNYTLSENTVSRRGKA